MNKLSIKYKLFLISLVPIISILYLSLSITQVQLKKINTINNFDSYLETTIQVNKLITNLQIERGLSSAFTNNDEDLNLKINEQFKLTDIYLKNLSSNNELKTILVNQNSLKNFRDKTIAIKHSKDDILNYYTKVIHKLFIFISKLSAITNDNELSMDSLSLFYLTKAKEFAGQERALGANIFLNETFSNESFVKIKALQSQYNSEINSFYALSSSKIKNTFDTMINSNSKELKEFKFMEDMLSQNIYKKTIISDMKALAGYGGLIHNFKNYLLRGDIKYKNKFHSQYKQFIQKIKQYKQLNSSGIEIELLNDIQNTFEKYKIEINNIEIKKDNKLDIRNIDIMVKINDSFAIAALNSLSNNILGVNAISWFNLATSRIDKLTQLENDVINDIKVKKDTILNDLYYSFYKKTILILLIIIITIFIANMIVTNISDKLNSLKIGLLNFFEYINHTKKTYDTLKITGNDEIDHLAKSLNKGIQSTSIYIEEKIKTAANQDKQIYESAKMAQMGEMIGNIAHQWRQPLSVISTVASGIQAKQEMGILKVDTISNNMEQIVQNTTYLSETIDIFSNFIKEKKELKSIILQDEINTSLKIIESNLKNNHIELINNIDYENKLKVNLVSGELPQVIINIINNAKDILLENNIKDAKVIIDLEVLSDKLILSIEDNAGGIPSNIINKIFDPYFTTKHQSNGTGLGLHMSYKIITESLDGKLYVKNTNLGAKFFIELNLNH